MSCDVYTCNRCHEVVFYPHDCEPWRVFVMGRLTTGTRFLHEGADPAHDNLADGEFYTFLAEDFEHANVIFDRWREAETEAP